MSVVNMRVDKDTEIDGMEQPIEPFYVSGISEEYNGNLQIRPQVYHDFSTTTDPGFENNFKLDNHWQNRPTFWEFHPLVETPSFTVEQNGTNVYDSDEVFSSYDGSYSLKMWGSYTSDQNMEHSVFQIFEGDKHIGGYNDLEIHLMHFNGS